MTVWRVGMEAVCIHEGRWHNVASGQITQHPIDKGDVFAVIGVTKRPSDQTTFWKRTFGKRSVYLRFKSFPLTWFEAEAFRPAQKNSSEIIARIKACRPARQPVEA